MEQLPDIKLFIENEFKQEYDATTLANWFNFLAAITNSPYIASIIIGQHEQLIKSFERYSFVDGTQHLLIRALYQVLFVENKRRQFEG